MTRRVVLLLTLKERAVFSARAATEGEHQTLDIVPGAALLGWAAARLYSKVSDAFAVFHSGLFRFSNGLPLTGTGVPAYPVPQVLKEPKRTRNGVDERLGRLDPSYVRVGEPPAANGEQYEAMRGFHVAGDFSIARPRTGRRLKTAVEDNRAAQGQLFGYGHLEAGQRFVATIEADPGTNASDWQMLLDVFREQELALGRSRGTEYGGHAHCEVEEVSGAGADPVWPAACERDGADTLVVWALSDLALTDARTGQPTVLPSLFDLFPSEQVEGSLDRARSAIATRRYAPWNGWLKGRDSERLLIGAGSVLSFRTGAERAGQLPTVIGRFQEAGLGRIWINPPLLREWHGKPRPTDPIRRFEPVRKEGQAMSDGEKVPATPPPESAVLLAWMRHRHGGQSARKRDEFVAQCKSALEGMYSEVRLQLGEQAGPSGTQWGEVLNAIQRCGVHPDEWRAKLGAMEHALFGGKTPVCGTPERRERTLQDSWGAKVLAGGAQPVSFADWLRGQLTSCPLEGVQFIAGWNAVIEEAKRLAQGSPRKPKSARGG